MTKPLVDVFADTAFWVALIDKNDQRHSTAIHWSQQVKAQVVTTDAVLTETANHLSRPKWRSAAVKLIERLAIQSKSRVIDCGRELWLRGIELYRDRPDKAWSLTDCISFVVMRDLGLTVALTSDDHFRQAGFRALLLESP